MTRFWIANFSLVNAGSEVGHSDKDGMTALHCTASLGFSKCVQVSSPTKRSVWKNWFGLKKNVGLFHHFPVISRTRKRRNWVLCLSSLLFDLFQSLISLCGADVEAKDRHGSTPLHYSVTQGHKSCTKLLLQTFKANPNVRDIRGRRYVRKLFWTQLQLFLKLGAS